MTLKSSPQVDMQTELSPNSSFDFTGWKLEDVRAALTAQNASNTPIVTIETIPAQRRSSTQTFGCWRVLRCQKTAKQQLELIVARELLTEERRFS